MGLLDTLNNPYFQLGSNIFGNAYNPGGQFGPALSGGIQDTYKQQYLAQQEALRKRQMEMQEAQLKQQQADRDQMMKITGGIPWEVYKYKNPQPEQWEKKYQWLLENPDKAQRLSDIGAIGGNKTTINMPNATQAAKAATGFRIDQAAEQITALEDSKQGAGLDFWDSVVTAYAPYEVASFMRSDGGNKIAAAQDAWIETFGRDASGAAIPKTEWGSWRRTYFPQPGDSPEAIEMKRQNRKASEAAIKSQALGGKLPKTESAAAIVGGSNRSAREKIESQMEDMTGGWKTLPDGTKYRVK